MSVLGKAGEVFGVCFYPSDEAAINYLLIQNQSRLGIDGVMANAISTMVGFYFEKQTRLGVPYKDPYKSDFHFTSAYLAMGTIMHSFLPKSIALRALNYLECANRLMAGFASSPKSKLEGDRFYEVILDEGLISVEESDPNALFSGRLPINFRDVSFPDPALKFKKSGSADITVKCLPNYRVNPKDGERRIENFVFVALLCDHANGLALSHAVGIAEKYPPSTISSRSSRKAFSKPLSPGASM